MMAIFFLFIPSLLILKKLHYISIYLNVVKSNHNINRGVTMNINDMIQESKIMTGPFPDFDKRSYENALLHFNDWFTDAINSDVKEPTREVDRTYDEERITHSKI